MSKNANKTSMSTNHSSYASGYVIRRNARIECFCQDESVMHTISDINNVNYGRKFWGCRNYRNYLEKGYNFFKWLVDETVDERDLKLQRNKKKIARLKNEVLQTKG